MKYSIIAAALTVGSATALSLTGLSGLGSNALASLDQLRFGAGSEHLIELDENTRQWMTENEVLELKRQGTNFIDVTAHADYYDSRVKTMRKSHFPSELAFKEEVHSLIGNLSKADLESTLTQFTSYFTRYAKSDSGLESSLWLYEQVKAVAAAAPVANLNVSLVSHEWKQRSVIARIIGSKSPGSVIVIGAHLDSINYWVPSLLGAPGADDDGSGSMVIFEVFRVLAESGFEPRNTLEFHWYSAEELGLLGSQDIFAAYDLAGVDVKAMLQQDMAGYSAGTTANGNPDKVAIITDFTDKYLTNYTKLIVTEYCDIGYVETECGYACSDHASAMKFDYPSAFVVESIAKNSDQFIHSTKDTVDRLDFDHMLEHAKLTLGFAYELSEAKL